MISVRCSKAKWTQDSKPEDATKCKVAWVAADREKEENNEMCMLTSMCECHDLHSCSSHHVVIEKSGFMPGELSPIN